MPDAFSSVVNKVNMHCIINFKSKEYLGNQIEKIMLKDETLRRNAYSRLHGLCSDL